LQALEWVMQQNMIQAGVMAADWEEILKPYPFGAEPAFLRSLAQQVRRRVTKTEMKAVEVSLREQLAGAVPNRRRTILLDHIRKLAAQVLSLQNSKVIDPDEPLQSMGLDSLMAVELRNKLGQSAGKTLPATLLFEYPTINSLADYLANGVFALELNAQKSAPVSEAPPADQSIDSSALDDLSDDELVAMLKNKLGQLDAS
jgi:acyl carrier protein